MPELPEAEVAARQLRERVVGAIVRDCWVGREDIVREGLSLLQWFHGAAITGVERRGKSVIIAFSRAEQTKFLVAELGMTGLLLFRNTPTRLPQHTHFALKLEGGRNLRSDIGILVDSDDFRYWIKLAWIDIHPVGLGPIL